MGFVLDGRVTLDTHWASRIWTVGFFERIGLIFASDREPTATTRLLGNVINTVLYRNFSIPDGVLKVKC